MNRSRPGGDQRAIAVVVEVARSSSHTTKATKRSGNSGTATATTVITAATINATSKIGLSTANSNPPTMAFKSSSGNKITGSTARSGSNTNHNAILSTVSRTITTANTATATPASRPSSIT